MAASLAVLAAGLAGAHAAAAEDATFTPGAAGIGDPSFPRDGNGGYDVEHYGLDVRYDPATRVLEGVATIRATATQNLSRYDLDLDGLTVREITVGGVPATWARNGGELVVTPQWGILDGVAFTTVVRYDGVPLRELPGNESLGDDQGVTPTSDGVVIAGQPHAASAWFPANDHPLDPAAFSFRITVPEGRTAVANGELVGRETSDGWTTWTWEAEEPIAPYMATATVGTFDLRAYEKDGIRYWDAVDTLLGKRFAPRTGERFAISGKANSAYKRLIRTVAVPGGGGTLDFSINRQTEPTWDYVFVEAHTPGRNDWTTLRDGNGHTTREMGQACPYWHDLHPFLAHYQTPKKGDGCTPKGSTGEWWAATGFSEGYERWSMDLDRWAGGEVEVSITYASDDVVKLPGIVVDDIDAPGTAADTSFEDGRAGWRSTSIRAEGADPVRPWRFGRAAGAPAPLGPVIDKTLRRQPEFLRFLADLYGPYPFATAGAIVHKAPLGFALELGTRPTYPGAFFDDRTEAESVVVHELAHQWLGDAMPIARWRDIWLNEGFATYTQWLWAAHEGVRTAQEAFDSAYEIPAGDEFWKLRIGAPRTKELFDGPVYDRGAMTLHQLRLLVGDATFFQLLREWVGGNLGRNVTTSEFVALAERLSGRDLSGFFKTWLFTGAKPKLPAAAAATRPPGAYGGQGGHGGSGGGGGHGGAGGNART